VVVAPNALREAEMGQKSAKVVETDVRVGVASQDAFQGFCDLAHCKIAHWPGV
jgi:hypothetical protein